MPDVAQMTRRGADARHVLAELLGLAGSIAIGIVLYLWAPIERGLAVPSGVDTPAHLWRARLVASQGLNALLESSHLNFQVNPDRLGLPILASMLTGVGVGPWRLMFIIPALSAAVLGAAAWALARAVPEPAWGAPIYAAAVVASISFAVTTRSHLDNALADGLIVAAAAAALLAAGRAPGVTAGALLLAGALLMHWPTGSLFALALGIFAVLLIPSAIVERRSGSPLWSSGAVRVGAIVGGGLVAGGLPLLATPGANLPDRGTGAHFRRNVKRLLPLFRLPVTLGLAGIGAIRLFVSEPSTPRRRALLLATAWLAPIGLAAVVYARGELVPLTRFLQVAFPIPILGAGALVGLVGSSGRVRVAPVTRAVLVGGAIFVAAAALVAQAWLARDAASGVGPSVSTEQLGPIRAATAFIAETDPASATIVADRDPGRAFRRVRMLATGPTISRIGVFPGTAEELFSRASGPPEPIDPALEGTALKREQIAADAVARMRVDGAVALSLRPFARGYDRMSRDPRNIEIADGVLLLRAEETPQPVTVPPLSAPPPGILISAALVSFAVLALAGSGWSAFLLAGPWAVRFAFAPALGLAVSILTGTTAGLAGVGIDHDAGLAIFAAIAVAGWATAWAGYRLRHAHATSNDRLVSPG